MKYEIVEAAKFIATSPVLDRESMVRSSRLVVSLLSLLRPEELALLDPAIQAMFYRAKTTLSQVAAMAEGYVVNFKDCNDFKGRKEEPENDPFIPKPVKKDPDKTFTDEEIKKYIGDPDEWSEEDLNDDEDDELDDILDDDDDDDGGDKGNGPGPKNPGPSK